MQSHCDTLPAANVAAYAVASQWITFSTFSASTGSRYSLSAEPAGAVCTVAMLGLTSTTWMPSSFKALIACEPE